METSRGDGLDSVDLEQRLQKAFSKRVRLAAENPAGNFSSVWMFWGNQSDFYFGSKSLLGSFKVSLHENGIGYVAYHKPCFLDTWQAWGCVRGIAD